MLRHVFTAFLLSGALAAPQAQAPATVVIASKSPLLDFRYDWPREAAAIPLLDRRFRLDAARTRSAALKDATGDRASRGSAIPFHQHEFRRDWTVAGNSPSLLSLRGDTETYTGGAHGGHSTLPLLWNRRRNRDVGLETLLLPGQSWNGAIRQPFCVLLNRERANRRGAPVQSGGMFSDCPKLSDLRILLADSDHDGRFDHLLVVADEYVAGPYAEGRYVIPLPITAAMAARIRPDVRTDFRPQPPVQ